MQKICDLINSEQYNSSNFSEALTAYVAGYKVPDVDALLEFIAPSVVTPSKRFEFKKFGEGAFAMDDDDERAVGASFKVVSYSGEIVQSKLVNRGLQILIDNDDFVAGYENKVVGMLKQRLMRNELSRAIALLKTAAGNATAKKWMPTGTGRSIPDTDLADLVTAVGDDCGVDANRVLIGSQAWSYRYAGMIGSAANGESITAGRTPAELAAALAVDDVVISKARYEGRNSSTGAKEKKQIIDSKYAFAFTAQKGMGLDDPSALKRFNSGPMKAYLERKDKVTIITVEHYSLLAQTGIGAVKALSITNS